MASLTRLSRLAQLTAEPVLYAAELMVAYDRVLSSEQANTELGMFVTTVVRHFGKAAARNPLLYVEGLFGVGARWRKFCEVRWAPWKKSWSERRPPRTCVREAATQEIATCTCPLRLFASPQHLLILPLRHVADCLPSPSSLARGILPSPPLRG